MTESLHDMALVPEDRVGVEILSWVEPEVHPLFPVTYAINVDIGLNDVGLACSVTQKLEIELVVGGTF